MTGIERDRSERYYRAYQRTAVVCLLTAVVVGGYFLAIGSGALRGGAGRNAALSLVVLFAVAFVAVPVVTLWGHRWGPRDPHAQRVMRDEWTRRNWNRACRVGFGAVMWAQLPLAFLLDRLAAEPSLPVMAGLSMTLGLGAFWATYLYVGRQPADG
jgi:hypothetical protein